jgi:hypothetical protein
MENRTREMGKRISVWMFASLLIFVLGVGMIGYNLLSRGGAGKGIETVVVLREIGKYTDLPNKDVGTVVVDLKASEDELTLGGTIPTRVQLFRSKIVEGLSIEYIYGEKRIVSGMPRLSSSAVSLFDGNLHHIAYSFKRGEKQQLYFDGNLVAESVFEPTEKTPTGFVVKVPENEVSKDMAAGFEFYDRAMSQDEIKALVR